MSNRYKVKKLSLIAKISDREKTFSIRDVTVYLRNSMIEL